MTQGMQERTDMVPDPVEAVLGQLMGDFATTAGVMLTTLGRRLGLWDAPAAGPAPAEVIAVRAGAAPPYVREWLRSQAAAGYVSYDPAAETFGLAPGVAAALGDGPLSGLADGMAAQFAVWWAQLDRYEAAFRTGEGIAWGTLPTAHAEGMDLITRAVVAPALVGRWAGRFFYAASALVCVPNALSDEHAEAPLGSIPGERSLRRVASAAGFSRVRRVQAGAPLNLLLELRL